MRFKIEIVQVKNNYELRITEMYAKDDKTMQYHVETKLYTQSRRCVLAEYERMLKDLQINEFKLLAIGEGDLPYCMFEGEKEEIKALYIRKPE